MTDRAVTAADRSVARAIRLRPVKTIRRDHTKKRFALLAAVVLLELGSASPAVQAYERVAQEETGGR